MKYCFNENCNKTAIFNILGTSPKFCANHKEEHMINLKHKHCEFTGCNTLANYNLDGEKKGKFCSIHKLDHMVNISSKRCIEKDCNLIASFNFEGKTNKIYCSNHKLEHMINVGH